MKAVEDAKINLSTTEVEATGFYSEAIETLPNERVALVRTSNPQRMSHESAWLEALMDKLYKAYSPTRVDAVMMAVMYEEETIEGIGEGIVNAGARLHRFPEQRCINNVDENALEHGLGSWASGWGHIVFGRVGVVAA